MTIKKKKAAKKKAAPRKAAAPPKPAGVSAVLYFQDQVDLRAGLYRLTTSEAVSDGAGGLDLTVLPKGEVDQWNGVEWLPATLPPLREVVKNDDGSCARGKDRNLVFTGRVAHTKNAAGIGV